MHNRNMTNQHKKRRIIIVLMSLLIFVVAIIINTPTTKNQNNTIKTADRNIQTNKAIAALDKLAIKGRAPKTNYSRAQFGEKWIVINGCDMRNIILNRDMTEVAIGEKCEVIRGILNDPYSGKIIYFIRGTNTSSAVQIDHVVALSDAWQKGAQQLSLTKRIELANDPLELLAVSGQANTQKSDGDAATWLPSNKSFRCSYVSRQIAVKYKYELWMTQAEHDSIYTILKKCPNQSLPTK
jgi:hypothetical protein